MTGESWTSGPASAYQIPVCVTQIEGMVHGTGWACEVSEDTGGALGRDDGMVHGTGWACNISEITRRALGSVPRKILVFHEHMDFSYDYFSAWIETSVFPTFAFLLCRLEKILSPPSSST